MSISGLDGSLGNMRATAGAAGRSCARPSAAIGAAVCGKTGAGGDTETAVSVSAGGEGMCKGIGIGGWGAVGVCEGVGWGASSVCEGVGSTVGA